MNDKRVYFFIGTNAELIKLASVFKELKKRKKDFKIISSGQNNIRFEDLKDFIGPIKPDISFGEKVNKSSIYFFIFWAIKTFFRGLIILRKEFKRLNKENSYLIIQGDTVTSTIGALIGWIYKLKIVHIESGSLSFNIFEPFPEEICRSINIRLADILFPPTDWAMNNLKKVNIKGIKITTKQNTIIESYLWAIKHKGRAKKTHKRQKYYILFLHRQENVFFRKDWSKEIMDFIITSADSTLTCCILNHPLTVKIIKTLHFNSRTSNIKIISQLAYPDFIRLMNNAEFIVTDSNSIQQEAYYMGKPFLALRDYYEQIEGKDSNVVTSKNNKKIMKEFLLHYEKYKRLPVSLHIRPSKIIVDYLFKE